MSGRRRPRATTLVACLSLVALSLAMPFAPAHAATELLANGTFEGSGSGSVAGWGVSGGSIGVTSGSGGGHGARITATAGVPEVYAYTASKPVTNASAGASYVLSGSLRADGSSATVCLQLKEIPPTGATTIGSAQSCVTSSSSWQAFAQVPYTVKSSGDRLTVNVARSTPPGGWSFDIDDLSLVAGSGQPDTGPPSVPQHTTAVANGPTSATVSWDPSVDDVGVSGYDVNRDGSRVATVGGTTTSWTDTGLSPQTTYSYTVVAKDAAGHVSGPSAAATVTTPASGGGGTGLCGIAPISSRPYDHIVVIMDENLTYPDWQHANDAPYTHMLADDCRLLTNAAGETHPSFPNYLAVASGTFETCLACSSRADNVFHQLNVSGGTWKDYNQSMPRNCSPNTSKVPQYRSGHNPAFWFTNLGTSGNGTCATNDVPLDPYLWNDIAADRLPDFAWIAPDDCYDMHWRNGVCENVTGKTKASRIRLGDDYIKRIVSAIAGTSSYRAGNTLVIVTWDESNEESVLDKGNWGMDCSNPSVYQAKKATCQVTTILVSARIPAGSDGAFYSHYSLTRAIEQNFGLPLLGGARNVARAPID
jgi:phosphoesterase family protein/fibronectin type III domain protein